VHSRPPEEFLDQLHQRLVSHTEGHLTDDAAMVLLERVGA